MGLVVAEGPGALSHRRPSPERPPRNHVATVLAAPLPHERRLYEAQRDAFYGQADADRPVSPGDVVSLGARVGLDSIAVAIDNDGLEPRDAVAIPSLGALRFHSESLTLWIAVHEVTHLLLPAGAEHGPMFVSMMLRLIGVECGQRCSERFQAQLLNHAVPMLAGSKEVGVFVLRSHDRFLTIKRNKVRECPAQGATRFKTLPAAERAARRAREALGVPVEIVQLA